MTKSLLHVKQISVRLLKQVLKQQEPFTSICSNVRELRRVLLPKECQIQKFHIFGDTVCIFKREKNLSEPVHPQNHLWSLILACARILYLKSSLILNKFLLFQEFLKKLQIFEETVVMTSQQKLTPHLIKVDHCGVLCFQNIDFDSDMARAKYLLILLGTSKEKTDYTSSISQKHLMGDGKQTENKEIYPSFKKRGDSGFMKGQRNLSLITSQPTRLTRLHPISD